MDIGGPFFVGHLLSASHAEGAWGIWPAQLLSPPPWRYDRSDLTVLTGIAKPRPTLPAPEVPGLSEASVWIALYVVVEPVVPPLYCWPPKEKGHCWPPLSPVEGAV